MSWFLCLVCPYFGRKCRDKSSPLTFSRVTPGIPRTAMPKMEAGCGEGSTDLRAEEAVPWSRRQLMRTRLLPSSNEGRNNFNTALHSRNRSSSRRNHPLTKTASLFRTYPIFFLHFSLKLLSLDPSIGRTSQRPHNQISSHRFVRPLVISLPSFCDDGRPSQHSEDAARA